MVNEINFSKCIRKNISKYKNAKCRIVPAFTIQALQKNTVVAKPPRYNIYEPQVPKISTFRKYYDRGFFPMYLENSNGEAVIRWNEDIENLDYHYYLPLFFDGLVETDFPYNLLVQESISDLLQKGGTKISPIIPQLIIPIKKALNTKDPQIVCNTMKCLEMLVCSGNGIGEALVPYYRQILPIFNLFINKEANRQEDIDYCQFKGFNIADQIQKTLEILEKTGGPDAFMNIKYMVPTFESCVLKVNNM